MLVAACAVVLCAAHATFMGANAARIFTREISAALASNVETMADVFYAIHTSVHESSEVKTKEVESLRRVNLNELSRETGLDKITLSRVLQEMISARMTKPAKAEVPQGCQNMPSASLPPSHTIPIIPDSIPTSYTFPKVEEKKPNGHSQPPVDLPTHTSIPIPDSTKIEDIISHAQKPKTPNQQAAEDAAKLGFKRAKNPPFNSHNQWTFKKGQIWITRDVDGHKGGVWKMFDNKGNRKGTCDANLDKIGD